MQFSPLALIFSLAAFVLAGPSFAIDFPTHRAVPDEILIRLKPSSRSSQTIQRVLGKISEAKIIWSSKLVPGLHQVRTAPNGADAALQKLSALPEIQYASPSYYRKPSVTS